MAKSEIQGEFPCQPLDPDREIAVARDTALLLRASRRKNQARVRRIWIAGGRAGERERYPRTQNGGILT